MYHSSVIDLDVGRVIFMNCIIIYYEFRKEVCVELLPVKLIETLFPRGSET